jgi:hypothetical protein
MHLTQLGELKAEESAPFWPRPDDASDTAGLGSFDPAAGQLFRSAVHMMRARLKIALSVTFMERAKHQKI